MIQNKKYFTVGIIDISYMLCLVSYFILLKVNVLKLEVVITFKRSLK